MSIEKRHEQESFGFEEPAPANPRVGCAQTVQLAQLPPEIFALGRRLPTSIRLATSSWSFPGWRGLVYAEEYSANALARNGLRAYSQHPLLGAAGLDRTFYGPLTTAQSAALAAQVPDDFRFVVKAPRSLTTAATSQSGASPLCDPLDWQWASDNFLIPLSEGMGHKLGVVVFQFQPHRPNAFGEPAAFAQRLYAFLSRLPNGPRYAVEIRNREWLNQNYVDALCAANAVHCLSVHPRLPGIWEQLRLAGAAVKDGVVLRWNLGHGRAYKQAYDRYAPFNKIVDPDLLNRDHIARLCARAALANKPAYVCVNNKAEGCAPASIERLASAITDKD